jgi:hypothetical protein
MAKVIAILAPNPHLLFFYLLFVLLPFFQQIFSVHAFAVDTKPTTFPKQTARVAQRHAVLLPSRALDPIHPAFAPHRRLFHTCFFCCDQRERHVTFQEKREKKGKKKNESPIRLPHDAHSTWFADRLPFVVVVLGGEEVVKALTLPPSSVGGDEASFISTHMRRVITFLFLSFFFVLVVFFLDEFS